MARKPTTKTPGTEVVDWEEEMARQAQVAAATQRSTGGGGKNFSLKGGILSYDGEPCVGNRIMAVVVADILLNKYFDTPYVEGEKISPKCFAFGKTESELEPHDAVDAEDYFERQNDVCKGCEHNEWGSARTGRGKACTNSQRLALISAGNFSESGTGRNKKVEFEGFIEDEDHYATAEIAYLELSPMNVKHYANFVKSTAAAVMRPPHAVFVEIWVEPDPKSQFKVCFELTDKVPSELIPTIMARHTKEQAAIDYPFSPPQAAEEAPTTNNKLRGKKAPAKR